MFGFEKQYDVIICSTPEEMFFYNYHSIFIMRFFVKLQKQVLKLSVSEMGICSYSFEVDIQICQVLNVHSVFIKVLS